MINKPRSVCLLLGFGLMVQSDGAVLFSHALKKS
jgi:hypothetical protein